MSFHALNSCWSQWLIPLYFCMNLLGCLQFPQSLRCRFLPKKDTIWCFVGWCRMLWLALFQCQSGLRQSRPALQRLRTHWLRRKTSDLHLTDLTDSTIAQGFARCSASAAQPVIFLQHHIISYLHITYIILINLIYPLRYKKPEIIPWKSPMHEARTPEAVLQELPCIVPSVQL